MAKYKNLIKDKPDISIINAKKLELITMIVNHDNSCGEYGCQDCIDLIKDVLENRYDVNNEKNIASLKMKLNNINPF